MLQEKVELTTVMSNNFGFGGTNGSVILKIYKIIKINLRNKKS